MLFHFCISDLLCFDSLMCFPKLFSKSKKQTTKFEKKVKLWFRTENSQLRTDENFQVFKMLKNNIFSENKSLRSSKIEVLSANIELRSNS